MNCNANVEIGGTRLERAGGSSHGSISRVLGLALLAYGPYTFVHPGILASRNGGDATSAVVELIVLGILGILAIAGLVSNLMLVRCAEPVIRIGTLYS